MMKKALYILSCLLVISSCVQKFPDEAKPYRGLNGKVDEYEIYSYRVDTSSDIPSMTSKSVYKFDEKGNLILTKVFSGVTFERCNTEYYKYDKRGRMLECLIEGSDHQIFSKTIYGYEKGRCTSITEIDADDSSYTRVLSSCRQDGDQVEETWTVEGLEGYREILTKSPYHYVRVVKSPGAPDHKYESFYNDKGLHVDEKYYDGDKVLQWLKIGYDEEGREISKQTLRGTLDGNVTTFRYVKTDEHGNWTCREIYRNGTLVSIDNRNIRYAE